MQMCLWSGRSRWSSTPWPSGSGCDSALSFGWREQNSSRLSLQCCTEAWPALERCWGESWGFCSLSPAQAPWAVCLFLGTSQDVPGTEETKPLPNQNPAEQLKLLAMQRHPGNDDDCSLCWERDPLPESAFGRVCLTSCQINIYSQIYLFAFVIENSCGFFLCVCVRCFVPLVCFWLHSAGERGSTAFPGSSRSSCCS